MYKFHRLIPQNAYLLLGSEGNPPNRAWPALLGTIGISSTRENYENNKAALPMYGM